MTSKKTSSLSSKRQSTYLCCAHVTRMHSILRTEEFETPNR